MTIGELSQQTGLSPKTIRFYEQINLISSPKRSGNGYRSYSPSIIPDLQMIKTARDMGLPIPEIKKLMRGCQDGHCRHHTTYLQTEIDTYTQNLSAKILQLQQLQFQLAKLKDLLDDPSVCNQNSRHCCNILHQLTQLPKGGEAS